MGRKGEPSPTRGKRTGPRLPWGYHGFAPLTPMDDHCRYSGMTYPDGVWHSHAECATPGCLCRCHGMRKRNR